MLGARLAGGHNHIGANAFDLLPRDQQIRLAPQKPKKSRPSVQHQRLHAAADSIELQIVRLAQIITAHRLDHIFLAQLLQIHLFAPFCRRSPPADFTPGPDMRYNNKN